MNLKKIISKGLIIGLLVNNIGYSLANTKDLDKRYETFEGNNITIDNILEEDAVNVEVEGNTLVNLVENISTIGSGNPTMINVGNVYTTTTRNNGSAIFKINTGYNIEGKTITLIFNYSSTDNIYNNKYLGYRNDVKWSNCIVSLNKGLNIVNYTIPKDENYQYLWIGEVNEELAIDTGQTISDLMILEGDWTYKEIPEYFEGLKSVGEIENNKFEIKSENKNLFDIKKWENGFYNNLDPIEISDNKLLITAKINDYFTTTGATNNTGLVRPSEKKYLIKVKPNTSYTLSMNVDNLNIKRINYLFEYNDCFEILKNHNFGYAEGIDLHNDTFTFITTSNTKYIGFRLGVYNKGESITYSNIQLSENCVFTNYNAYISNKKELNLKEPLRALPNGAKDKIIKRNGQWVIERNLGEVILDGINTSWIHHENVSNTTTTHFQSDYIFAKTSADTSLDKTVNVICDNFESEIADNQWFSIAEESLCSNRSGRIGIRIKNSRLTEISSKGVNEWLKANPIKVVYLLPDTIYEPLNIDSALNLYLEKTYISNNSNIPANMKVTVDRAINRATEAIQLAQKNPTLENISIARMWINLMKESSNKDTLHDQLNSITEIQNLTIENKTTTANVDVYIKSKNGLSMTLSTNSIIFDEFSGTEDMEKLNAVEVTVDSSLPYRLNTYLLSEIKNENSSKIIPKELFNIKLNGETDYKAFNSINEKLVLKEDCSKGENRYGIDLILKGSLTHEADVYKTTIKFEAEQK